MAAADRAWLSWVGVSLSRGAAQAHKFVRAGLASFPHKGGPRGKLPQEGGERGADVWANVWQRQTIPCVSLLFYFMFGGCATFTLVAQYRTRTQLADGCVSRQFDGEAPGRHSVCQGNGRTMTRDMRKHRFICKQWFGNRVRGISGGWCTGPR